VIRWVAVVPLVLLAMACSGPRDTGKDAEKAVFAAGDTVKVVFAMPGDDIGSPETAALLEKIKASIAARDAGKIVRTGFGMGTMEVVVKLHGNGGLPALEESIRSEYPRAKYHVERAAR
jgi:hypothetical protein